MELMGLSDHRGTGRKMFETLKFVTSFITTTKIMNLSQAAGV
jgi:hypothetical protein